MMARTRNHGRDRIPPKIQQLRWSGAGQSFLAQSAGSTALAFVSAGTERATLMRLRGELFASMDGAQAPGVLVQVSVGVLVVQEGAATTVRANPVSDSDAPWYLFEQFVLGYEEMVTDVVDVPGITSFRKTIDIKAMRILRPDREMQLVVTNTTLGSAGNVNVHLNSRGLFGAH